MKRLRQLCQIQTAPRRASRRQRDVVPVRRACTQNPQRLLERNVRGQAVDFSLWTGRQGWTVAQTATHLRLSPRTLRQWQHDLRHANVPMQTLGRPLVRASVPERNQVITLLDELGPALGVPTLQECFPNLARAELEDLVRRYRRVWRKRYHQALHILHWQEPGRVWAMDFSEAPTAIDGLYPYLLAVRDLTSGQQLLWQPVRTLTVAETLPALASLFALYGPPLVLKSDNGSAFLADQVLAFLHQAEVIPLFSPPHWPRYNGAIEAGIGSLKTRTEDRASRQGRPGQWTWDDTQAARLEANATARPKGPAGPTPDQAFAQRRPITTAERTLFAAAVDRARNQVRAQEGRPENEPFNVKEERAMDRKAISRALVELGYLRYSRRRFPLPITKKKTANIT